MRSTDRPRTLIAVLLVTLIGMSDVVMCVRQAGEEAPGSVASAANAIMSSPQYRAGMRGRRVTGSPQDPSDVISNLLHHRTGPSWPVAGSKPANGTAPAGASPGGSLSPEELIELEDRVRAKSRMEPLTGTLMMATSLVYATNTLIAYFRKEQAERALLPIVAVQEKMFAQQVANCITIREVKFQVMMFQYTTTAYTAVAHTDGQTQSAGFAETQGLLDKVEEDLRGLQTQAEELLKNAVKQACFPSKNPSEYTAAVDSMASQVEKDIAERTKEFEKGVQNAVVGAIAMGVAGISDIAAKIHEAKQQYGQHQETLVRAIIDVAKGQPPYLLTEKFGNDYLLVLMVIKISIEVYQARQKGETVEGVVEANKTELLTTGATLLAMDRVSNYALGMLQENGGKVALDVVKKAAGFLAAVGSSMMMGKAIGTLAGTIVGMLRDEERYKGMAASAEVSGKMFARECNFKTCSLVDRVLGLTESQNELFEQHTRMMGFDGADAKLSSIEDGDARREAAVAMHVKLKDMCLVGDTQLCFSALNKPAVRGLLEAILKDAPEGGSFFPTIEQLSSSGPITDFAISTSPEKAMALRGIGFTVLTHEVISKDTMLWYCRACDSEAVTRTELFRQNPLVKVGDNEVPRVPGGERFPLADSTVLRIGGNNYLSYWSASRYQPGSHTPVTTTSFVYDIQFDRVAGVEALSEAIKSRWEDQGAYLPGLSNVREEPGFLDSLINLMPWVDDAPMIYESYLYYSAAKLPAEATSTASGRVVEAFRRHFNPVVAYRVLHGVCPGTVQMMEHGWRLEYSNSGNNLLGGADTTVEDAANRREVWALRSPDRKITGAGNFDADTAVALPEPGDVSVTKCVRGPVVPAHEFLSQLHDKHPQLADVVTAAAEFRVVDTSVCSVGGEKCLALARYPLVQRAGEAVLGETRLDVYVRVAPTEGATERAADPSIKDMVRTGGDAFVSWKCSAMKLLGDDDTCQYRKAEDKHVWRTSSVPSDSRFTTFWFDGMGAYSCTFFDGHDAQGDLVNIFGLRRSLRPALDRQLKQKKPRSDDGDCASNFKDKMKDWKSDKLEYRDNDGNSPPTLSHMALTEMPPWDGIGALRSFIQSIDVMKASEYEDTPYHQKKWDLGGPDKLRNTKLFWHLYKKLDCRARGFYAVKWRGDGKDSCEWGRTVKIDKETGEIIEECDKMGAKLHIGPVYLVELLFNEKDFEEYPTSHVQAADVKEAAEAGWQAQPGAEATFACDCNDKMGMYRLWTQVEDYIERTGQHDDRLQYQAEKCGSQ